MELLWGMEGSICCGSLTLLDTNLVREDEYCATLKLDKN